MFGIEIKKMIKSRLVFAILACFFAGYAAWGLIVDRGFGGELDKKIASAFRELEQKNPDEASLNSIINETAIYAFSEDNRPENTEKLMLYLVSTYMLGSMKYADAFSDDMYSYVTDLVKQRAERRASGKDVAYLDKMISCYNVNRKPEVVCERIYEHWLTDYAFSKYNQIMTVLMMLIITVLIAFLFHAEDIFRMRELTLASVNGRRIILKRKLAVLFITIFILGFLMTCISLAAGSLFVGIYDWNIPMQSLQLFKHCPFTISFLQYAIVVGLLRTFVLFVYAGLLLLLDRGSKGAIRVLVAGVIITVTLFILSTPYLDYENKGYEVAKMFDGIRAFCPFCLIAPGFYFSQFDCVMVFGVPVFRLTTAMVVGVAIIVFGVVSCMTEKGIRKK